MGRGGLANQKDPRPKDMIDMIQAKFHYNWPSRGLSCKTPRLTYNVIQEGQDADKDSGGDFIEAA